MAKSIFLHIGTHKTGSTSIQHFLMENHALLADRGFAVYGRDRGTFNHTDLYLAAQRPERDSFAKLRNGRTYGPLYTEKVKKRVLDFLSGTEEPNIIMSTEGLSLLRYDDEIDSLRTIIDGNENTVRIILYLRNKSDFLASYRRQVEKYPGRQFSQDRTSVLYAGDDSWIADFDGLRAVYERGFPGCVTVIDYDAENERNGNVLPSFLNALGLDLTVDLDKYFLNVS